MLPLCDLLVVSIEFYKVNQIKHVEGFFFFFFLSTL
jgi:hypothetical protein